MARSSSRRAQGSFEFIVLLGFMVVVFLGFFVAIETRIADQQQANRLSLYVQLADYVEKEMLLASQVRPGYICSFPLPAVLQDEPYNLTLEDGDTLVIQGRYSQNEYIRFLDVNVTLVPSGVTETNPDSFLPPGDVNRTVIIEKNDTGIYIRKDCERQGLDLAACQATG